MRKKRDLETDEERSLRLSGKAQQRRDDVTAEDDAVDEMVKRSIEKHGP